LSTQYDWSRDAAQRIYRDRLLPLPVVRSINGSVLLSASWIVSGALFGLAAALVVQWSLPAAILAAVVAGALSWLGRGVANLVLACIVMLVLIAFAFQAVHFAFSGAGWSLSWLRPCALVGVILLLWFGRRLEYRLSYARIGALVELAAAAGSLLLALRFVSHVSSAGSNGAGLFLATEDHDAWINLAAILHNSHGASALTGSSIGAFGPVIATYVAAVRAASSGVLSTTLPLSSSPKVVLAAYGLSVVSAPIVAALVVRRLFHLRSAAVALLVWACATVLVVSSCIVWMGYGSLSAAAAILLMLSAAYLISLRPRLEGRETQITWLVSALLLFGAGSTWVALLPLAGAAIAVCCLPVLGFALKDFRRTGPIAAILLVAALAMELELLQQYRNVVDPVGGKNALLTAGGATPSVTAATEALMLLLLFAIVWLSSSETRLHDPASERGFTTSLVWLLAYVVAVLLVAARSTGIAPGYGPTKLQFMVAAVWVPLALIEVVSRLEIGRQYLRMVAVLVVSVLWASTIQGGPIYDATTRHWPNAAPKTVWYDTVERQVSYGARVLCLPVGGAAPDPNSLDQYDCSRFASSVQGKDDKAALTWRFVTLGRLPVSDAVVAVKSAKDKPWRIVVIGPMEQLHNSKGWWAPIAKLPGLEFVPVSG
jgi:hypothetical protein